jgi:hypothetical protein
MKKIESIFHFTQEYTDANGETATVTVVLEINYLNDYFSVKPYCGTINMGFKFEKDNMQSNKWIAIINAIREAIEFGRSDLKTKNISDAKSFVNSIFGDTSTTMDIDEELLD